MLMAVIELNQAEPSSVIVESGDIVTSGALRPCLGVVIYSRKARQAYAAHLIVADDGLEKLAICAIARFGPARNLQVYLTGASLESIAEQDTTKCILDDRAIAQEILRRQAFDPAKVHVRWGPQDAYTILTFDPAKGEATLNIKDYSGNDIYLGRFEEAPVFVR